MKGDTLYFTKRLKSFPDDTACGPAWNPSNIYNPTVLLFRQTNIKFLFDFHDLKHNLR